MSYKMPMVFSPENKTNYANEKGNHECVTFVRMVSKAPSHDQWKAGIKVVDAEPGSIPYGTAIATFDEFGHYLKGGSGHQHAAIYISHEKSETAPSITVFEQYNRVGKVVRRTIHNIHTNRQSDNPNWFYVIE
jgi:hypothetical protein